eukprot:scaffold318413_cov32-Tisochrysis_lutea.AAC.2
MPPKGSPAWHAMQKGDSGKTKVDKTFGMKNKKGKAVQSLIAAQRGGQGNDSAAAQKRREEQKKAEAQALEALLFQVSSDNSTPADSSRAAGMQLCLVLVRGTSQIPREQKMCDTRAYGPGTRSLGLPCPAASSDICHVDVTAGSQKEE